MVCALVLITAVLVERYVASRGGVSTKDALVAIGLRAPTWRTVLGTFVLAVVMLGLFALHISREDVTLRFFPDAPWLALGMFAQGGVAEEVVFRGYLFRHLRTTRSFWRAATLATVPFLVVHLLLFATLDFFVALSSLVIAVSISFPLAWLFERSGNSIWPPAAVHALVQAGIKLIDVEGPQFQTLALFWMAASAALPWGLFLLRRPRNEMALGS